MATLHSHNQRVILSQPQVLAVARRVGKTGEQVCGAHGNSMIFFAFPKMGAPKSSGKKPAYVFLYIAEAHGFGDLVQENTQRGSASGREMAGSQSSRVDFPAFLLHCPIGKLMGFPDLC